VPNRLAHPNRKCLARPDVVCLQEAKAAQEAFPAAALRDGGYGAVWQGERGWNGVAILAPEMGCSTSKLRAIRRPQP
jgi:exonuclease III